MRHLTRYRYAKPVAFGEHRMMFRPREGYDQRLQSVGLTIRPTPVSLRFVDDVFGNTVGLVAFEGEADELSFESRVELDHRPVALGGDRFAAASTLSYPMSYSAEDAPDLARSIERIYDDPVRTLERWARRFVRGHGPTGVLDLLQAMTQAIHADFSYGARLEVGTQPPLETLRLGTGSCRDLAVLMIEAVRSLNIAARFVSGYVYSTAPGGQPHRAGTGHTHAWVSVYLPRCGWVEFDPTNGIVGSTDLIRVAVARDPRQALPLSGTWEGSLDDYLGMDVDVDVRVLPADALRRAA